MRQQVIDHLEKIGRMRSAQRKYFKGKQHANMLAAKQLEMEVDIDNEKLIASLKK